jgi:hypothetical protein
VSETKQLTSQEGVSHIEMKDAMIDSQTEMKNLFCDLLSALKTEMLDMINSETFTSQR